MRPDPDLRQLNEIKAERILDSSREMDLGLYKLVWIFLLFLFGFLLFFNVLVLLLFGGIVLFSVLPLCATRKTLCMR